MALKAVDFSGHDLGSCVREFGARRGCYRLAAHKLLKEMVLLERLRHPNVLQVRGCGCGAEGAGWTCPGPVSLARREPLFLHIKKRSPSDCARLNWGTEPGPWQLPSTPPCFSFLGGRPERLPGSSASTPKQIRTEGSKTRDGDWSLFGLRTLLLAGAGVLSTREMTPNQDAEQSSSLS